jgi:hypothetical protein
LDYDQDPHARLQDDRSGPTISRRQALLRGAISAATVATCAAGLGQITKLRAFDWLRALLSKAPGAPASSLNPIASVVTPVSVLTAPIMPTGYFHGLFTVNTVTDIEHAAALGINFTVCYGWNSEQVADPGTPEGQAMIRHGMKTFLNIESRYLKCTDGVGHLDDSGIRQLVGRLKTSPIVAGYWTKDDDCGDERDAVKQAHDLIRSIDLNPRHLIMPGYGGADSVQRNYVHGQADLLGFYPYPTSGRGPSIEVPDMLRIVRQRTPPGAAPPPFIGVYQAFGNPPTRPVPTQAQILAQAQAYVSNCAIGLAGYGWKSDEMSAVASSDAGIRAAVSAVSAWLSTHTPGQP